MMLLLLIWIIAFLLDVLLLTPIENAKVEKIQVCSIEQAYKESELKKSVFCGDFKVFRCDDKTLIIKKLH